MSFLQTDFYVEEGYGLACNIPYGKVRGIELERKGGVNSQFSIQITNSQTLTKDIFSPCTSTMCCTSIRCAKVYA